MVKFSGSTIVKPAVMSILRFMHDEHGATSIEYAVIASGVAVAIAATVMTLGSSVKSLFTSVAAVMN
jgi:pilus assembly protein Flp/PilA